MKLVVDGHCLCGAVRYTVTAPFEYVGYCHCSRCRQSSSSAFALFAGVKKVYLQVTQGADSLASYVRNADTMAHFCRQCSSVLFVAVRKGEYANVQMGTLLQAPGIRPQSQIPKASWDEITDGQAQFTEFPDWR
jgi:hypothetical protein